MFSSSCFRRTHQLRNDNGLIQQWNLGDQVSFKFSDVPLMTTALQKVMVNYGAMVRLIFRATLTNTAQTAKTIHRKNFTPLFIQSAQLEGTEIGTPISSSHMLGGLIDADSYYRAGMKNNVAPSSLVLTTNTATHVTIPVDLYLGNFSQRKGWQTCPLCLFLQPGQLNINTPQSLGSVFTDVTVEDVTVTAHLVILCAPEIIIANPWQMTRHKATAANGADSVLINSFGASSTLTGVQSKAGIGSLLWASSKLVGDSAGPGTVANITQFAADFLGLRQNNDPAGILYQFYQEINQGGVNDIAADVATGARNLAYPYFMFDESTIDDALNPSEGAAFFPIILPSKNFDASKLLSAVGNPSYNLTGTFSSGASHYTIMEGCYPFTLDKLNDLLAIIQRAHIGQMLYNTDDLILDTKLADDQDGMKVLVQDPDKLVFVPRQAIPRASAAAK